MMHSKNSKAQDVSRNISVTEANHKTVGNQGFKNVVPAFTTIIFMRTSLEPYTLGHGTKGGNGMILGTVDSLSLSLLSWEQFQTSFFIPLLKSDQ